MKRIVIKIGTNSITNDDGTLNMPLLADIVDQIALLRKNHDVLIVTSGAVGAGKSMINILRHDEVTKRQIYAAIGQVKLMTTYSELFKKHDVFVAQMLMTKMDFVDREHYLNTKNCLESLFKEKIVPIMNENDVVAVQELMFTDNDELAAMIAKMLSADLMIILSNVDGVYDGKKKVIPSFNYDSDAPSAITASEKSSFGKGGMLSKFAMAKSVAENGTAVVIANSKTENVIVKITNGENMGTRFIPKKI
ncbi:MAG: glutamate 5-kinase [Candidatus Gracilibacteria bacterium]|jgi:glutamate 5-kinase